MTFWYVTVSGSLRALQASGARAAPGSGESPKKGAGRRGGVPPPARRDPATRGAPTYSPTIPITFSTTSSTLGLEK